MRKENIFLLFWVSSFTARANTLDNIRKKYDLPAVGYIEIIDGKIGEPHVSGVRKYGTPETITKESKFHLGSCGKSMTAMLVHTFIAEEKLSLHTKLKDLDRMFGGKIFGYPLHKGFQNITIGDLLTHRSGIPNQDVWEDIIAATKESPDVTKQRASIAKRTLMKKPGGAKGRFAYSNVGYMILASILENMTGKPWEILIQERIFDPLGMKSASISGQKEPHQPWPHIESAMHPVPIDPQYTPEEHLDALYLGVSSQIYMCKERPKEKLPPGSGLILTNENELFLFQNGTLVTIDNAMNVGHENVHGIKVNNRFGIPKAKGNTLIRVQNVKQGKKIAQSVADVGKWLYSEFPPVYRAGSLITCSLEDWAKFVKEHIDGPTGKSKVFARYSAPAIKRIFKSLQTPYPGALPKRDLPRKELYGCHGYSFGGFYLCHKKDLPGEVFIHHGTNTINYANFHIIPQKRSALLFATNVNGFSDKEEKAGEDVMKKIFRIDN